MKILIKAEPKEISALVAELAQERIITKKAEKGLTLLENGQITVNDVRICFGLEPLADKAADQKLTVQRD